jgi:rod shape-determining protein MreC
MKSAKLKYWLLLVAIAILLIILDRSGYFNWLKRPIGQLVNPVKHAVYLNKVSEAGENQVEKGQLAIVEAELVSIALENEKLRKLLGTKLPPSWRFVPANILAFNGESMKIDIGQAMEINKDMMVMALVKDKINGGVLVGKIDKVELMNSTVKLTTDQEIAVKAKTEFGVEGMVKTQKNELKLVEVLQVDTINPGELILTQGVDGWLPGLVIGRVGEVSKIDTAIYQSAKIEPIMELSSLRQVFVVSL